MAATNPAQRITRPIGNGLEEVGRQLAFYARLFKEVWGVFRGRRVGTLLGLVSDITIGAGALIVGGGMVFVIFSMSFFTGTEVGLQGFKGLQQIGAEAFTGLVGSDGHVLRTSSGLSDAKRSSTASARLSARSAARRGGMA